MRAQAQSALFMMNNLHYMVKTVESSEALTVLGEEWIEVHKDQVNPSAPAHRGLQFFPCYIYLRNSHGFHIG